MDVRKAVKNLSPVRLFLHDTVLIALTAPEDARRIR
jgi:hypothetical protein